MATERKDGWIDAHVHVWPPDTQRYPLDKDYRVDEMKPKSFTPEELFVHTRPSGVARIVLIQMSFYRYDNAYMLDTIARYPGVFSGVGIVDTNSPELAVRMKALAEGGVRGFRVTTRGNQFSKWLTEDGMSVLWSTAARKNLAVCPLINPADIPIVDELCRRHPDTTVVVDHFARVGMGGLQAASLEALCQLARHPKVHVKTSAFYAVGGPIPYDASLPMLRRVIEAFGPQRLMWASDCPFQVEPPHTYDLSLAMIRDRLADLSDSDKAWILRGTADKVFFSPR
jgi:predicted TIM-barrel fold metal-dependent hydrolase